MQFVLLTTIFYCFVSIAICLSITTYFRLPNVVGYLVAGILAGPVLRLIVEGEDLQQFSEVGVLMLLFTVGIKVDPIFLIRNAKRFSFAAAASFFAIAAIHAVILHQVFSTVAVVVVSTALAFSSQLIAFQSQNISKIMKTTGGQLAVFSLIFQLFIFSSVFLFLRYVPGQEDNTGNLFVGAPLMLLSIIGVYFLFSKFIGTVVSLVVGRDNRDLLLMTIIASLMAILFYAHAVNVSPQILFLVAGVSLGRSPYSFDIINFVEPIAGIFSGLFLFSLGLSTDIATISERVRFILVVFPVLILAKAAVLLMFGYLNDKSWAAIKDYIWVMLPTSELGLVMFSVLGASGLISYGDSSLLSSYFAISMIVTSIMVGRRSSAAAPVIDVRRMRVFFSYSRKDESAVKVVAERLEAVGLVPLIDTRVLPHGREWQQQLSVAIRSSDVVLWFVSPDSVKSQTCVWELHQAVGFQKRVVPVRLLETDPKTIPHELAAIQFLPASDDFRIEDGAHWSALFNAITEHDDWIRFHTSLLEKATNWGAAGRNTYMLLGREELTLVDAWWASRPGNEPPLSFTISEFVSTSREALSQPEPMDGSYHSREVRSATSANLRADLPGDDIVRVEFPEHTNHRNERR